MIFEKEQNDFTPKRSTPGSKDMSEKNIGNTIAYDVKSFQVKTNIVNRTDAQLKGLKYQQLT